MKKKICSTILLSVAIFSFNNSIVQAFEMPKVQIPGNPISNFTGGGNSAYSGQISTINDSVAVANDYMKNAVFTLSSVLLNKDDVQKFKLRLKEIQDIKKPKEKEAAMNKLKTENAAQIQSEYEKGTLNSTITQLSAEQKKLYSDAVFNVGLAGLNYTDAGLKITSLVQSISANPASATSLAFQLKDLKNMAVSLPEQAKTATALAINLVKVGKIAKIPVKLPTSKTENSKVISCPLN